MDDNEKIKDICIQRAIKHGEDPYTPIITGYHGHFRRHELWEKYYQDVVLEIRNRKESD